MRRDVRDCGEDVVAVRVDFLSVCEAPIIQDVIGVSYDRGKLEVSGYLEDGEGDGCGDNDGRSWGESVDVEVHYPSEDEMRAAE